MTNLQPSSTNPYAELFEKVLARPPLYVGNCSIIRIGAFMEGYMYAKLEAGEHRGNDLYKGFTQWVAKRFKIQSMHNWVSIIDFVAGSEASAFEMTKKMWGEYKTASEKKAKRKTSKREK